MTFHRSYTVVLIIAFHYNIRVRYYFFHDDQSKKHAPYIFLQMHDIIIKDEFFLKTKRIHYY